MSDSPTCDISELKNNHREVDATLFNQEVLHFLRRTSIALTIQHANKFAGATIDEVIDITFASKDSDKTLPLKRIEGFGFHSESIVIYENNTWINEQIQNRDETKNRRKSLKSWLVGSSFDFSANLTQSLRAFWVSFFFIDTENLTYPIHAYRHFQVINHHALGSYRDLFTEIILCNGIFNYVKRIKPADTLLMDAFIEHILINYLVGSEYTQLVSKEKIKTFKRLLNEWNRIKDLLSASSKVENEHKFIDFNIDDFSDRTIVRAFYAKLDNFITKLFKSLPVAEFVIGKLFTWFYHPDLRSIDISLFRKTVDHFQQTDFQVLPAIRFMLKESPFAKIKNYGIFIKSPGQFLISLVKDFNMQPSGSKGTLQNYLFFEVLSEEMKVLGENTGTTNWSGRLRDGRLQEINSFEPRNEIIRKFLSGRINFEQIPLRMDLLHFIRHFPNPERVDKLLADLNQYLYPKDWLSDKELWDCRRILIKEGETAADWTKMWQQVAESAENSPYQPEVVSRLTKLVDLLLTRPAYQYF